MSSGSRPAATAAALEIWARAAEMGWALEAARSAPEMRADKVADVRWRIAHGTYVVDAELIAQRMLGVMA
jgi:flagellar biosynthesis anti-sigma factor FlgM